mmetsp:Transcript_23374/g.68821  ORF Transcript_23374/g.68821 Transcript_23374/m.68821 type:complete len:556 (+) Transcript_23374:99-1766(+)
MTAHSAAGGPRAPMARGNARSLARSGRTRVPLGPESLRETFDDSPRGLGHARAGPKDGGDTRRPERRVVRLRDHPAHHHHGLPGPLRLQRLHQGGNQSPVSGCLRRHADHVDIRVRRLARHLPRRLEKGTDIHVKAQVRKGRGDDPRAAVVAVLPHLCDQNARPPAEALRKALCRRARRVHLPIAVGARLAAGALGPAASLAVLGEVDPGLQGDRRYVAPPSVFESLRDFAHGGLRARSVHGEFEKVLGKVQGAAGEARGGPGRGAVVHLGGGAERGERCVHRSCVPAPPHRVQPCELRTSHARVVDDTRLGGGEARGVGARGELVDTHDHVGARVNARLLARCRLLDAGLWHARCHGARHAAERVHLRDESQRALRQLVSQGLHHVGAAKGVGDAGHARLVLQDELRVPGDAGGELSGQTDSLVKGVGVQGLGAAEHGGHRLHRGAHHVVHRVLLRQRPSRGLAVRAQQQGFWVGGREALLDQTGPEAPRGAELCDLEVKVHAHAEEEGHARRHSVHRHAPVSRGGHVLQSVSQRVGELESRVRARLLHVVSGD